MIPAYSVIFFTVASGAGYGLLTLVAIGFVAGWWSPGAVSDTSGRIALVTGTLLVAAGLTSSTLHLGHPERAWRAFSEWRSSWLSREGVLAVASFAPLAIFACAWLFLPDRHTLMQFAALALIGLSLATVYSTAMIYASLKPIPRWSNAWVPPVYCAFMLAGGAPLALLIYSIDRPPSAGAQAAVILILLSAWLVKVGYWRHIDGAAPGSSSGTATGLDRFGTVSALEAPHTSANYVLKEMGFVVARRHARRLRRIALLCGALLPTVFVSVAMLSGRSLQSAALCLASLATLVGLVVERWLFFAEARHVVTLFYGEREV